MWLASNYPLCKGENLNPNPCLLIPTWSPLTLISSWEWGFDQSVYWMLLSAKNDAKYLMSLIISLFQNTITYVLKKDALKTSHPNNDSYLSVMILIFFLISWYKVWLKKNSKGVLAYLCSYGHLPITRNKEGAKRIFTGHRANTLQCRPMRKKEQRTHVERACFPTLEAGVHSIPASQWATWEDNAWVTLASDPTVVTGKILNGI